ncbi:hypothetical protein Tco_0435874 [Tanacetum coccineum]
MHYPRFTKVIIDHFISKDNTISIRNKINLHTARDDSLLGALKFVSKTEDFQKYGELIHDGMINDGIKQSQAYNTYLDMLLGKFLLRMQGSSRSYYCPPSTGVVIRDTPAKSVSKKKAPAKVDRGKGIELLSDVTLLKDAQLKKTLRKSNRETHKLQTSDSSEGSDFESKVPNEQTDKTKDTSEGTGVKPGVSKADSSNSDNESWGDSEDESEDVHDEDNNDDDDGNGDDNGNDDDGGNDTQDSERTDSDDDENPSFILKDYEEEEQEDEYVHTQETDKSDNEEKMHEEEDDDVAKKLYGYLNITQRLRDTDMTNAEQGGEDQQNASHEYGFVQEEDDGHVTLTTVHDKTKDVNKIASLVNTSTVPPLPPPINTSLHLIIIPQKQTPDSITTTTNPTMTLPEIPNFASLFQFNQRVSALETKMSEFNQTSQFVKVVSSISSIVNKYLASKMKEAVDVAIIKEQVKAQVSKIMPQIEKYVTESLGAEILIDKMETNKSINRSDIQKNLYNALVEAYNLDKDIITSYGDVVTLKRGRDDQDKDEDPSVGSDRGTKRRKSSKDAKPSKGSKSKKSKSSSSSKGTQSQPKSLSKSTQAEELEFEVAYT